MGWLWSFVSLDDNQLAARRMLLDRYANIAQLSVVVPLLALQLVFFITWLRNRSIRKANFATPGSPTAKHARASDRASGLITTSRRFFWGLGGSVDVAGVHLGTKAEVFGGLVWALWLLLLSVLQTGDDYLHLTKRFGIVAASQLPFHYLLATKTPFSPLQLITRSSHETLNAAHQTLGRVITGFFYAHAVLYLNFYVLNNLLLAKVQQVYVLCGIFSIIFFTLIGTSSLEPVRRWNYRIFLGIHISLSIFLLPILWFHVHHIRIYIYETLAVVVANLVLRATATKQYSNAQLKLIANRDLIKITIPLQNETKHSLWQPGQHAYISIPSRGLNAALARNPFTLSSLPLVDKELCFVARVQSGNTARLAAAANSVPDASNRLLVEGPYGLATHADALLGYDRVLLIAGGIGGTFIVPLYRQLLADLSPSKGSHRRQKVTAVWVARTAAEVEWAIPSINAEREGFLERLTLYTTRDASRSVRQESDKSATAEDEDEDGIELQERTNLLKAGEGHSGPSTAAQLSSISGRPDIPQLVEQALSGGINERVAIIVCGPISLGRAVRSQVQPWVYKGRDLWFWNESFSL